ncbi:MAG: ribbon-helix-helix protein, CopG family [bacterium]|nr:ribbon-helix-helix protein, CopG family [bacterium]
MQRTDTDTPRAAARRALVPHRTLYLPDSDWALIVEIARAEDRSASAVVRHAVREYAANHPAGKKN